MLGLSAGAVAVVFSLVTAGVAARYAWLAFPQADDLAFAVMLRTHSVTAIAWYFYQQWSGRWAAMLLEAATSLAPDLFRFYPWMILGAHLLLYAGACCTIAVVAGRRLADRAVWAGGLVVFAFLWLTMPYREILYWIGATDGYLVPLFLLSFLLLLLRAGGTWAFAAAAVTALLLPAFHELTGAIVFSGVLLCALAALFARRQNAVRLFAVTGCLAVGTAVVVLSPGTQGRIAFSHRMPLLDAAGMSVTQVVSLALAAGWPLLVGVFLVAAMAMRRAGAPAWFVAAPRIATIATLLGAVLVPFGTIFLSAYAQTSVPARVYDEAYVLACGFAAGFAACCGFALRGHLPEQRSELLAAVATIALVVLLVPSLRLQMNDLSLAQANKETVRQRIAQLVAARQGGRSAIELNDALVPMRGWPTWLDITADPSNYKNTQYADYFGLKRVVLGHAS